MEEVKKEVTETTRVASAPSDQQVVTTTKQTIKDPGIKTEPPQKVFEKKKTIFRVYQIIWYFLGVIEVLLIFRCILKLLGSNPNSGFANLIYSLSAPFALPFIGIIPSSVVEKSIVEWSTYFAMVFYFILAYGIVQLLQFIKPVSPEEVEQTVDST